VDQPEGTDFSSAARGALRYLRSRFGFDLWMVTRAEGDESIVLEAEGDRYGIVPYTSFKWADSFCSRMAAGRAPRIAPDLASIPAYASAGLGRGISIGAYIGVPLTYQDGALFGTLCAFDSNPQPQAIEDDLPLVEMVAKMLSGVLAAELRAVNAERQKERNPTEAETDTLTDLLNRHGWDRMLQIEGERCRRYCNSAFVVLVDLDGLQKINESLGQSAGDKLIRRTAKVLCKNVRETDVVARLAGDKFGILGIPGNPATAELILGHIRKALERAGIRASAGMAARVPALQLGELWVEADQQMYGEKTARKLRATAGNLRRISRSQTFPLDSAFWPETGND